MNQKPTSFFEELKRRNVVRVGVVYLITAWLLAQVADLMLENFHAPDWVIQSILVVLIIGFPVALIFAWAFELTPEGLKKEKDVDRSQSITPQTGRKLDFIIIGILAVALGYFIWESRFDRSSDGQPSSPDVSPAQAGIQQAASDTNDVTGSENHFPKTAEHANQTAENGSLTPDLTPSIAVLPFVNMSSDPEQEYFSDGISEEILNSLAKVKELKVAGRTSSFAFKGENQDLRQVGNALGVANILEGSVRKSGNKVRITAQLIQVGDGFHLWSESYDRELNDVFAIQDEIAKAILDELKLHLLDEQPDLVESARTDTEAYGLYLLAKQRMYERTGPSIESAAELLDRAIKIDPAYAPAYAQRGIAEILLSASGGSYGDIPLDQALTKSKPLIDKALQLDPNLAEGWAALGLYFANLPASGREAIAPLQKALELNPNLIDASNWLAVAYNGQGRPLDAKLVVENMTDRDPLYRPGVRNVVNGYVWFGQYDKAREFIERVRTLIPNDATIASSESSLLSETGQHAKALQEAEKAYALQPSNTVIRSTRGWALMATQQLDRVVAEGEEFQPVVALTLLGRGEEARSVARKRLEQFGEAPTWLNFLVLNARWQEAAEYLDTEWQDVQAFERDYPTWAAIGYYPMLDVALAYSKSGNAEKFDQAMAALQQAHGSLLQQGVDNPTFFLSEACRLTLAGDREGGLNFLERAISRGYITTSPRIVLEFPHLEALENDGRFAAIQAQMVEHLNRERAELGLEPVSI